MGRSCSVAAAFWTGESGNVPADFFLPSNPANIRRRAERVTFALQTGFLGHVFKRSVLFLPVKPVPEFLFGLFRLCYF